MTKQEFAAVMAYIGSGCGKELSRDALRVYWDLLSDVPLAALQVAAKRALLESQYPVFPQVGVLRRLAAEAMVPQADNPPAVEAWGLVRRALSRYGYYRGEHGLQSLPPVVRRTVECLGWKELCDATETEIVRAQFMKAYEAMTGREQRERLLPVGVVEALVQLRNEQGQLTSPRSAG